MQRITEIIFIAFFKLETSNKNYIIQNKPVIVYTECHNNQSLSTQLILHFLMFFPIFAIFILFYFFFSKYITEQKLYCARIFCKQVYNAHV